MPYILCLAFKVHNLTSGENARCVADHKGNESACLSPVVRWNTQAYIYSVIEAIHGSE